MPLRNRQTGRTVRGITSVSENNNLMTKGTNSRTSIRVHGVLMVQTSSGTGWTSCSMAGTRTMPCQAAAAETSMWCWLLHHHLDGDSRIALVLPHSEIWAAVRRAEHGWTDRSSPGTVAQCSVVFITQSELLTTWVEHFPKSLKLRDCP